MIDIDVMQAGTFADDAVLEPHASHLRRRQEARPGVDRGVFAEQVDRRMWRRDVEIRGVERAYGPDVFPIPREEVRMDAVLCNGLRDHFFAEVDRRRVFEDLAEDFGPEDVNA